MDNWFSSSLCREQEDLEEGVAFWISCWEELPSTFYKIRKLKYMCKNTTYQIRQLLRHNVSFSLMYSFKEPLRSQKQLAGGTVCNWTQICLLQNLAPDSHFLKMWPGTWASPKGRASSIIRTAQYKIKMWALCSKSRKNIPWQVLKIQFFLSSTAPQIVAVFYICYLMSF